MQILHGTWIPESGTDFIQSGQFYLWVETTETEQGQNTEERHPQQLAADDLADLLTSEFNISSPDRYPLADRVEPCYFLLPTVDSRPLPSLELSRYLEIELPDAFEFEYWEIDCYPVAGAATVKSKAAPNSVIPLLNELHFLTLHNLSEIQLGADLLFWFHFTQTLKRVILKDHYIPALKYRALEPIKPRPKSTAKRKKTVSTPADEFEIYSGWDYIGEEYETLLDDYIEYMPLMCAAGFADPYDKPWFYNRLSLLRHFSECLLTEVVAHTQLTKAFETTIANSVLTDCLELEVWPQSEGIEQYQQWQAWRDRIVRTQTDQPFYLYFHLQDPVKPSDPWQLQFQVAPKNDPSLKVTLDDYWQMRPKQQKQIKEQLGGDFEQNLLLNLGYAARIYPDLWQGLETDQPTGIELTLDTAFNFLKELAWVLENAGYKVIVPAWWTPKGRQRVKVRLKARGKSLSGGEDKSKSYFSLDRLVEYQYELAIGGEQVTEKEWNQLVNAKTPLVKFRGQWMELDQDKMQQMLEFWKNHQ
ncbi:MAG: SNF2 helicase-associated domain-containing protein, partial [Cyanobacteria bacterium P01_H01_bin.105]